MLNLRLGTSEDRLDGVNRTSEAPRQLTAREAKLFPKTDQTFFRSESIPHESGGIGVIYFRLVPDGSCLL